MSKVKCMYSEQFEKYFVGLEAYYEEGLYEILAISVDKEEALIAALEKIHNLHTNLKKGIETAGSMILDGDVCLKDKFVFTEPVEIYFNESNKDPNDYENRFSSFVVNDGKFIPAIR